jgi:arsenical pump membrane protein
VLLVATGALAPNAALGALVRGTDVYLFLIGMMALAEFARSEGVFAWIARHAVSAARGSRSHLLLLVYGAGVATTAFLSNDATIVVLTPAVIGALAVTDADPEPYLFACAFVANAASLLLPIANPSNLVFFAGAMPPLGTWLVSFGAASIAAIVLTYAALAFVFRHAVDAPLVVRDDNVAQPRAAAFILLGAAAATLVATASFAGPLGAVTCAAGAAALAVAATRERAAPATILHGIKWPIVVLTAGLFVIVDALDVAGARVLPRELFAWAARLGAPAGQVAVAGVAALASNAVNNLPVGLDLGHYVASAHPPAALGSAALAGVNVGPNLTANGSLATILWLAILRREGTRISALRFAAVGVLVTPAALIAAALLAR